MNMRTMTAIETIAEKLDTLKISDDSIVLITLPPGLKTSASQLIGQHIVDALRTLGKSNPVIALPETVKLSTINEKDMKELGWIKDDTYTLGNNKT